MQLLYEAKKGACLKPVWSSAAVSYNRKGNPNLKGPITCESHGENRDDGSGESK